jgi:hypothetical protein
VKAGIEDATHTPGDKEVSFDAAHQERSKWR